MLLIVRYWDASSIEKGGRRRAALERLEGVLDPGARRRCHAVGIASPFPCATHVAVSDGSRHSLALCARSSVLLVFSIDTPASHPSSRGALYGGKRWKKGP